MFEEVLIATDGSECGMRAARAGVEFADTFDADVTVLVAANDELSVQDAEEVAEDVREFGLAATRRVRSHVVEDDPRRAILEHADDVDADVLVMGRHGHTGMRERIVGSVTERVLRATDRPVLTVPGEGSPVGEYEDVLVPTDGSDAARAAVRPGTRVATRYGARLHVLSVVDVAREGGAFSAGGVDDAFVEGLKSDARETLDVFAAACEESARIEAADGVEVNAGDALDIEQAVRTGVPSKGITAYVEEADVDFVAMASQGQSSLAGQLLGSTTDRVLRTVDVPLLVVHPK